ncbi:bis(5'-nucleosyl)-tetraphosphatase [Candidatus Dependentiae bacterium]
MKLLFSAGVVVYFKRKDKMEYLLLNYAQGHWGFPKGKIEKGEEKLEAATRELYEEAKLKVEIHDGFEHSFEYFFKDKEGELAKKKAYFFVGKSKTKHVALSHEHVGFEWLSYDDAIQKLTYDNAKELLGKVKKFLDKIYDLSK